MMWIAFALLSAFFAALTSILGKIGVENINFNLATAIRAIAVVVMAWSIVFITGKQSVLATMSHKNALFLTLSGMATGLSWLLLAGLYRLEKRQKLFRLINSA